ncbi:MAG TPA: TetR/AcrR family transcriptional regulator [Acidimicrobiales bacterium]|nr:TetR/AcrR family transcriptional regulator [Acidimicrobiales bacterium]
MSTILHPALYLVNVKMVTRPYHHGNLPEELLAAAVAAVEEVGPAAVSLRELARRVGVTHAAPAHHFGDKTGLLTALAAEGSRLLAEELRAAWERTGSFLEVGLAYVRFATRHRGHFEVMFRPDLYRTDDPEVVAAQAEMTALLVESASEVSDATGGDEAGALVAGWALMHGLATLWLNGNLPRELGRDPVELARRIGAYLFQASEAARRG